MYRAHVSLLGRVGWPKVTPRLAATEPPRVFGGRAGGCLAGAGDLGLLSECETSSSVSGRAGIGLSKCSDLPLGVCVRCFGVRVVAFGVFFACGHLGMCRSPTSAANLRPQCGQGIRVSSISWRSAGGGSPFAIAAAVFSAFWKASCWFCHVDLRLLFCCQRTVFLGRCEICW